MRRLLLALALAATGSLTAAGIVGKWTGTVQRNGGTTALSLILYQHGQEVSGTVMAGEERTQSRIEKAAIRGDQLTFEIHDSDRTIKFRLTVAEGLLSGEANAAGQISKVSLTPERRTNPAYAFEDGAGISTRPILLYKAAAAYTEEARAKQIRGTVVLQVEIGADGKAVADRITVVRGLGYGLDEMAIASVKQWKWKPATRNDTPVTFSGSVEVNFFRP